MTKEFNSWTEYNQWLVQNYKEFDVYKITEEDQGNGPIQKKIIIEYCTKDEYKQRFVKD